MHMNRCMNHDFGKAKLGADRESQLWKEPELDSDSSDNLSNDGGGGIKSRGFELPPLLYKALSTLSDVEAPVVVLETSLGTDRNGTHQPLMMSLVVWGWAKSMDDHFAMEFPVNSTIPLFGALQNDYGTAQSLLQLCPPDKLLAENLSS
ncbi:hypothetical protein M758_1G005600 [Ceratodon purpureus]|nr:hypothetical protein M758_1G005600 [Ceratodon purpureus]